ncbi:nuclear transport factor 2 family protein [Nocardioides sp. SYSU DS0651]|uniref:nuclear transport factor 2 family protein n=1 Tax=Nocardioides sp. SYSU DS0651 TaxID=3415955 RepID=UPI003F4BB3CA
MLQQDPGTDASIRSAVERLRVAEVMTSYALACDERDGATLERLFHPDAEASYDADADLAGGATIARWVLDATAHLCWQQHSLRVMRVELEGERASAVAYLTSHQVAYETSDTALMMNSRYDVDLVLADGEWRIMSLRLVVGTVEHRPVDLGRLVPAPEAEVAHV